MLPRLAIITTHPIQYYAPWFRYLELQGQVQLKVFYLNDPGNSPMFDNGFQKTVTWDVPLLEGYAYEFIENRSRTPSTDKYTGIWNPGLAKCIRDYEPDAVLLTTYHFASVSRFLWAWRNSPAPLIFRGDSHRLLKSRGLVAALKRQLISFIFSRFNAILYVGSANKDYFHYHAVKDEKLFYSPHAIDGSHFSKNNNRLESMVSEWKGTVGIPLEHRVILYAGKLEEKKRPHDLLWAYLAANPENTALVFVGSGKLEKSLMSLAKGHPCIFFTGFQNQSMMPVIYSAADVFVLPSYGPAETWGLAVNEAMSMGCAIIVSDHVGCAMDLVSSNENGLVFPAGNIEKLEHCLKAVLSDNQRLKDWGKRSIEIIDNFNYENTTRGLLDALHSVANKNDITVDN